MIIISQLSGAIITYKNKILLQKRPDNAKAFAGMWSIPGGKIEQHEHNNPYDACIREIGEETAINQEDISNIRLMYILLRRCKDEIRVLYVYHMELNNEVKEVETHEGVCRWMDFEKSLDIHTSFGVKVMLEHYYKRENSDNNIYSVTIALENNNPTATFNVLDNWVSND
jgi:8-oxo-dGTP diphosphatase